MRARLRRVRDAAAEETGSAAAEFAAVLPAVVLMLALCLGAVAAGGQYVRLVDAAADTARAAGRGDGDPEAPVRRVDGAAAVSTSSTGELVCVAVETSLHPLPLIAVPVSLRSCALGGGR